MTGYVLVAVPIIVVENFKSDRFGCINSRSIILEEKLIFLEGALRFRGNYPKRNDVI